MLGVQYWTLLGKLEGVFLSFTYLRFSTAFFSYLQTPFFGINLCGETNNNSCDYKTCEGTKVFRDNQRGDNTSYMCKGNVIF